MTPTPNETPTEEDAPSLKKRRFPRALRWLIRGLPVLLNHPGYKSYDRFFDGSAHYHLFRTCIVWTNSVVKAMGQEASLWAPFERSARYHLPRNRGGR